jgi:hypothetical protein
MASHCPGTLLGLGFVIRFQSIGSGAHIAEDFILFIVRRHGAECPLKDALDLITII